MTYRQLLLIAFVGNGLVLLALQVVSEFTQSRQSTSVLLMMYIVASLLTFVFAWKAQKPFKWKNASIGAMGGLGSAFGLTANIAALRYLPGQIVFPIVQGGVIVIVVLIGRLVFKEKFGIFGTLGIISGVAAIILLSMK